MDTLFITIGIAFILVMAAVGLLAISWLFTGKSTLRPGACGRDPTKKKRPECGSCDLCEHPTEEKKATHDNLQ